MSDAETTAAASPDEARARRIADAAERALAEAATRKAEAEAATEPTELGGRDGPSPTRFGDWEKKGVAVDF